MHPISKTEELDTKTKVFNKKCYRPVYVPFKTEGQNMLIPEEADMSRKDNLKLLYGAQPLGTCTEEEHDYLNDKYFVTETFEYSHEASKKQIMVQGVCIRNTSTLTADIKKQLYSVIQYADDDNTHQIPILVDNVSTLNIMPTYYYAEAYYLHHLPKEWEARTIHTGNGTIQTHFWIDLPVNIQGCILQLKLLVCDTQAKSGILLSKMALEQLQTWQILYIKQTALPLHAVHDIELLPNSTRVVEMIADHHAHFRNSKLIQGMGIVGYG